MNEWISERTDGRMDELVSEWATWTYRISRTYQEEQTDQSLKWSCFLGVDNGSSW